jgi:hypothetical protein
MVEPLLALSLLRLALRAGHAAVVVPRGELAPARYLARKSDEVVLLAPLPELLLQAVVEVRVVDEDGHSGAWAVRVHWFGPKKSPPSPWQLLQDDDGRVRSLR